MIPYNMEITIIGTSPEGEKRTSAKAVISRDFVHLPIKTEINQGDLIERKLPNGSIETRRVLKLDYLQSPFGSPALDHIEAETEVIPQRPSPLKRRLAINGLHHLISQSSATLFADGHYSAAVFEAFKAVEARVQKLTGRLESGQALMGQVFSSGQLDVRTAKGRSGDDEKEGFKLLFMGAMSGLRNPRGHGEELESTEEETLEYLALASMLMRRLELAEKRLPNS
ncbi:TIGR02391 family protein [Saccharothrix saharensis]|uniref:TIGR02391 family protein n=1 Tax=Saccharothrix saharensis TaxID=571190 RepID=UPI0036AAB52E